MSSKPKHPVPNSSTCTAIQDANVHKAAIAALLANAEVLCSDTTSTAEKTAAKIAFAEVIPHLVAINLHKHIWWKNPELQYLMEKATK